MHFFKKIKLWMVAVITIVADATHLLPLLDHELLNTVVHDRVARVLKVVQGRGLRRVEVFFVTREHEEKEQRRTERICRKGWRVDGSGIGREPVNSGGLGGLGGFDEFRKFGVFDLSLLPNSTSTPHGLSSLLPSFRPPLTYQHHGRREHGHQGVSGRVTINRRVRHQEEILPIVIRHAAIRLETMVRW